SIFYYYMVDKQSRMISKNPDQPIDYNKATLNVFEALTRYSLFEDK
ncbi:TPA: competence protein ComK, partial [Staphylococcus aureus]|nr:competence protein ComK [Staphylococcus aureus]